MIKSFVVFSKTKNKHTCMFIYSTHPLIFFIVLIRIWTVCLNSNLEVAFWKFSQSFCKNKSILIIVLQMVSAWDALVKIHKNRGYFGKFYHPSLRWRGTVRLTSDQIQSLSDQNRLIIVKIHAHLICTIFKSCLCVDDLSMLIKRSKISLKIMVSCCN